MLLRHEIKQPTGASATRKHSPNKFKVNAASDGTTQVCLRVSINQDERAIFGSFAHKHLRRLPP